MTDFSTTNYSDLDFPALKSRLQALILSIYPDWPVDNAAEFGNILLDCFAFVGDVANFYNDANYQEAYVSTAQLLQSMINLSEGLGVDLPIQEAATCDVLAQIANLRPTAVVIPEGTRFSTSGESSIEFRSLVATSIPSGSLSVTVQVEHSTQNEETAYPLGTSQWYVWLSKTPFLRMISVVDALGYTWTQQTTLIHSLPTDRHYETLVNAAGRVRLRFGDGVLGMIPVEELTIQYLVGGGSAGNVAKNTIRTLVDALFDEAGNAVTVLVNNALESSGGKERITAREAAQLIPASFRTQNRSVSRTDFEDNALLVPGVARAVMLTSNEDVGIMENMGHLIIVPEGGGEPSSALMAAVLNAVTIDKPCPITFQVQVMPPIYLPINVVAVVFRKPGFTKSETGIAIRKALATFFALTLPSGGVNQSVDFGGGNETVTGGVDSTLPYSSLYNIINDCVEVRKLGEVTLNGSRGDVPMYPRNFPTLGSITLVDGDTGTVI